MGQPLRVGFIGVGNISSQYLTTIPQLPSLKIIGVSDINVERSEQVARENNVKSFTVEEMLNSPEIDAILNITLPQTHASINLQALNHGKHVYVEKPMVYKINQGYDVIAAQKKYGKVLQVGSQRVSSIGLAKAKELLAAAGYANGFELPMPDISFANSALQAFIVKYLGDVGITVKPVSVAPATFVSEIKSGKHAATWFQLFQGTDWEEIKLIATQDATWNVLKYNDPQIAALVKKIQSNPLSIKTNAKKINQILVEKAWFVPLYRLSQQFFTNKKVDVDPTPAQAVPSLFNYSPAGN